MARFRWVVYKLKELRQHINARSVKKALQKQPSALNEEYRQMLLGLGSNHTLAVTKILQWICFCNRSTTLDELNEVLAVDVDQKSPQYDPELRLHNPWDIMEICSPLLSCVAMGDSKTYRVNLLHPSVKEYLQSEELRADPTTSLYHVERTTSCGLIAKVCLVYLLKWGDLDRKTRSSSLMKYAVDEWPGHYRSTIGPGELEILDELVYELVKNQELYKSWVRDSAATSGESLTVRLYAPPNPIYYMSLLRIGGVVKKLLEDGVPPDNPPAAAYGYALGAACHAGHEDVVRVLLEYGADLEIQDSIVGTPLHYAAIWGHEKVVEVLLEWGAGVNATNDRGLTPLDAALEPVEEVANEEDKQQSQLVNARIEKRKEAVAKMLVDHGADINGLYGSHGTRLMKAAKTADERAVRMLLAAGADPNVYREGKPFPKYEPGSPLHEAVCHNEKLVKMLLDAGADPNFRCPSGNPIQWAAGAGNENIVRRLIDAGADISTVTRASDSALHIATVGGHKDVVRLLLERGADPRWTTSRHGSILAVAIRRKYKSIEQLLLEHGATDTEPSEEELEDYFKKLDKAK